ncbi:hypothetical protein PF005_g25843 [Phytophthora fragariae]|nr:hypothetical protein PF009_g26661 [Phytophthora fragariae]KAE9071341.1 hypothetical protein PF007_g26596 [Phytophthora fragariae]KAE9088848.1 hypothetical protein PF006_g25486 [Phytophthora fragariae]KAE9105490.1 hypothetical protein PF010_g13003 [Phytophthora fragariae]KAE9174471.1 hypothetical protein PF005_g25843 [Phytophthora fragariae]
MSNSFGASVEKRRFLLQKVLRVMFFMECFLLSELMKALTPLMYSCYLVILYYWPNRRFYSQLEGLDEAGFWAVITHIQIYGILEVALFVVLIGTLHQMTCKSPLQQLAYAVNRNWGKIQCKLMIWLLLLVQSAIPQLGTDFTFKFEWIQKR